MALSSSICATRFVTIPASNSSISANSQLAVFQSSNAGSLRFNPLKTSQCTSVMFVAPEVLEVDDGPETIEVGSDKAAAGFLPMNISDSDKAGPKQN